MRDSNVEVKQKPFKYDNVERVVVRSVITVRVRLKVYKGNIIRLGIALIIRRKLSYISGKEKWKTF